MSAEQTARPAQSAQADREQIHAAIRRFDAEQRDRYWRGWGPGIPQPAIEHGGRLYPARHLVSMALDRLRYAGEAAAAAALRALGFKVVDTAPPQARQPRPPAERARRKQARPKGKRMTTARLAHLNLSLAPATVPPRPFPRESLFEQEVIVPILGAWGCRSRTQVTRNVRRGTTKLPGRIDFVVQRPGSRAVLTVIEAKRTIHSVPQLFQAARQAESYARALRLGHFVVAAPEGCWIFTRAGKSFRQHAVFGPELWDGRAEPLKTQLYQLVGLRQG